ncbi:MAG: methylenetetrahydrofolate--tRNA-(uracil(54)-C(5))-methyltransferase (FADH(2)-oxidizing) TrmFO, partial [Nitrospinota bacterium]|nr:methylenetetrahydrofolate--tRNA-(uracil(54)-C(5))-methyltransferase (FADH(2)-oxidizing) TrmFO [Nitrospinota bacterium]
MTTARVAIIGGGLAGCEAAWQIVRLVGARLVGARPVPERPLVDLFEMRPGAQTPAHSTDMLAELVCSNSLKSESEESPTGQLKQDMADAGSLILEVAHATRLPAGKALAVDRDKFAAAVTRKIESHPQINVIRRGLDTIPDGYDHVIVATGPLTSPAMEKTITRLVGGDNLYFYDAIAPIVEADSIDMSVAFFQDRYGPTGQGDYLNLPMSEKDYEKLVDELLAAEKGAFREFEKGYYFEGCMPIEEMASRGRQTLAFGPLKPVGLTNP